MNKKSYNILQFKLKRLSINLIGLFGMCSVQIGYSDQLLTVDKTKESPLRIEASTIQGVTDQHVTAVGNATLNQDGQMISAEELKYLQQSGRLLGKENVSIEQKGGTIKGSVLDLFLEKREGYLSKPVFTFEDKNARGSADMLHFEGKDKYRLENMRYTTCNSDSDAWFITSNEVLINRQDSKAIAKGAKIEFKGHNILYFPYFSLALDKGRHSGFLTPSVSTTGKSGLDITFPYYFNLAPNYDLTLFPRTIQKRGVYLGSEFRYLQPDYLGKANIEYLPNDALISADRYRFNLQHEQFLTSDLKFSLDLQSVSDDNYFRDLANNINDTSKTNLVREVRFDYQKDMWNLMGRIQRYQTLQDPLTPILPPYDRFPQIKFSGSSLNLLPNTNFLLDSEFVRFEKTNSVSANRFTMYPSLTMSKLMPDWHIVPKVGLHMTHYQLGNMQYATNPNQNTSISRIIPIASLDIGATLERKINLFDKSYYQTLEPRFYYLYVPYKDQSQIPLFDTTFADLSFERMFYENNFMGGDRISDANQVTLAVTSKLIRETTGDEVFRAGIGQRFYLKHQQVTLNAMTPPKNENFSDIITFVSGKLNPYWRLDSAWQYNPHSRKTIKANFQTRYQPVYGNVINAGYRFNRENVNEPLLKQFDIAGQWRLHRNWYGLGRLNYSIADRKVLEGLGGVEYNGGCWAIRVVGHRLATGTSQATTTLFVQLELNDVSRLGTNPIDTLRRNITGYVKTNEDDQSFDNFVFKNKY